MLPTFKEGGTLILIPVIDFKCILAGIWNLKAIKPAEKALKEYKSKADLEEILYENYSSCEGDTVLRKYSERVIYRWARNLTVVHKAETITLKRDILYM